MKQKKQKGGFSSMLLGTLGASLLGNLLAGKRIVRAGSGNKKGKGIVRASTGKQWDFQCHVKNYWVFYAIKKNFFFLVYA